jgi:hypothetical protein
MHRIPEGTDFSPLLGSEVTSISLGMHEINLCFHPEGSIRMEGAWSLKNQDGATVDTAMEHADRETWQVHKILGKKITSCVAQAKDRLVIQFEDYTLEIEDDSDHYECFAIEHPKLKLYV